MDIDPTDYTDHFRLASPVVVLGSVTRGGRRDGPLPAPAVHRRSSNFGTPFGMEEFAIYVSGYPVGLVFFKEGTGCDALALNRWNEWGSATVLDNQVRHVQDAGPTDSV